MPPVTSSTGGDSHRNSRTSATQIITPTQRAAIDRLRERMKDDLKDGSDLDTDFDMLRWLNGHDYDIDVIEPKLRHALQCYAILRDRPEMLRDETLGDRDEDARTLNETLKARIPFDYKHVPLGLMGEDREGNAVGVHALARFDVRGYVKATQASDLFIHAYGAISAMQRIVRQNEARLGRKLGLRLILDMAEFSWDLMWPPAVKIYLQMIVHLQELMPDFVLAIYGVNLPLVVRAVYAIAEPSLAKQTREKVRFLGDDWRSVLCEEIGAENLFREWGGTKEYGGLPNGYVSVGSSVPANSAYSPEKFPDYVVPDEKLTKLNVPAGSTRQVTVRAEKAGQKLRWFFKISSGDLDFGIIDAETRKQAWPKIRVTTEFVPEFHEFTVAHAGDYLFTFSNAHGRLWSKDVRYRVVVID